MKKSLLTLGALLLWSGTAFAGGAETVTLPADAYKAILEKLDTLQNRVNILEEEKKAPAMMPTTEVSRKDYDKLSNDIDNIYDTLDQVETKTLQDRISLGAELRTRVDNYKVKNPSVFDTTTFAGIPMSSEDYDDNNWTNRFRLNMDAKINPTLSFHGRMSVYKNWGDSDTTDGALYNDINRVHRPGTSTIKLDRAYIDWVPDFVVPIAVTIGRHPSTEGPPVEVKEYRKRQSTYPAMLFDAENDGIVLTLGLDRYTGLTNAGWRFAYGKGYHSDQDNASELSFFDDSSAGDTNMYATFLESQIPGVKDSLVVLSYAHISNLVTSFLGDDNPVNVGDMDLYGVHLQANEVLDSPFDVFVSWAGNETKATAAHPFGFSLLTNAPNLEDNNGYSIYAGLAYSVPCTFLNNPKVGFEYNHGSKYWMSMTMASTEPFNKLATRGDAYEVYYIQPVNRDLFFRAGYTFINYAYTGSGSHLGEPGPSDTELENIYLLMDVRF